MKFSVLQQMKNLFNRRRKWFGLALILFVVEMMLLVWPVGWISEKVEVTLDSGGMWLSQMTEETPGFCQEFRPRYDHLDCIRLFFSDGGEALGEGSVTIIIADKEGNFLFEKDYPYGSLKYNIYMDINVKQDLKAGGLYYLSVIGHNVSGEMPSLGICGRGQAGENQSLFCGDETVDGQLLMGYQYSGALTRRGIVLAVLLCAMTALVVAVGVPGNRTVRCILGVVLLLAWPWVMGLRLERLSLHNFEMLPVAVAWSIVLMYLFELAVLLYTLSLRASVIVTNLVMTVLYSANYFVYAYRGVPLKVNDFTAIRTAARVMGGYTFAPDHDMAVAWAIMLIFIVLGMQTGSVAGQKRPGLRWRLAGAALGLVLTVGVGYWLLYTDFVFEAGFQDVDGIGQNNIYEFNGYLIGTCMDIQKSRFQEPEGYSIERVEELLRSAADGNQAVGTGEELPHVVLIMNESFADLRVLGNLQLSQENLPFFNSLSDNTVRGYVNASVLGGGTANSEFEVFTGCSMGLLPKSYYPYQQCVKGPMRSMISCMNDLGYTTWAIHPELKTNWNRLSVYQYLGFDNCQWLEDFEGAQVIHHGVSDAATYERVEELFENRGPGERMFIFDLTIQNHGGYEDDKVLQRTVSATNASSDEADAFLSLMLESDKAFGQLIDYFSRQDEKVVVCMFGDHQPKFGDTDFYEAVYAGTEGLTEEQKQWNLYKTPFVIWANYDIEEARGLDISMNYLGVLLQKTAGIPRSPYFSFLEKQMEEYPVMTVNGYVDSAGVCHDWDSGAGEFPEYRMLQYNYLFDNMHTVGWGY